MAGEILSTTETEAILRIETIEGDTSVAEVGSEIAVNRYRHETGEHWLAVLPMSEEQWYLTAQVKSDGSVDCGSEPKLKLSKEDALQMTVATNCHSLFEDRAKAQGLPQQECNDTGIFPFMGCGCSGAQAVSMLALLPLLLRRRRR